MRKDLFGYHRRRRVEPDRGNVPVRLHIDSFRRFSRGLEGQLAKLEARWAHIAIRHVPRPPGAPLQKPKSK